MKLKQLNAEQIDYLHAQRARGFSVADSGKALFARWPKVHAYNVTSLRKYLDSEAGRKRGQAVLEAVREKALEQAFADKGSRLDLLNERIQSLTTQLRRIENPEVSEEIRVAIDMGAKEAPVPDAKVVASLNSELRQTVSQMQKEMEPLSGVAEAVAPAVAMLAQLQKLGTTPAEMREKIEAKDQEQPN